MTLVADRPFADPDFLPPAEAHAERARINEWIDAQTDCRSSGYTWHMERRYVPVRGGLVSRIVHLVVRRSED
jgi:hypothetical protein